MRTSVTSSPNLIKSGWGGFSSIGTPQGASASPLLANVYLHYVFDLWAQWWRSRYAHGDVIIVRFADDFIVGFEHEDDARRFLADLRERFAKFGRQLHPGKTRLIEFGQHAGERRGVSGGRRRSISSASHICVGSRRRGGSGCGVSPSRSGCG
jgi:RNA-directed DNA polymerase